MNANQQQRSVDVGQPGGLAALAFDDVLPWLTDPKIALACCPAHDITIRNWMLVGDEGAKSWFSELAVMFGSLELLAEIEVEQIGDGQYRACVSVTREPLLMGAATTVQGAMMIAEQVAATALCKACNRFARGDPPI